MGPKREDTKKKQGTQMSLQTTDEEHKKTSMSKRAGLMFPVGRVLRLMKKGRYGERVSSKAAIGVAAALEYLTAEILEMAGDKCFGEEDKMTSAKIKPRHICLAVKGDEELNAAIGPNVIIPMCGVIPHIHEELEMKPRRKVRKSVAAMMDNEAEVEGDEDEGGDEDDDEEEEDE
jgi:histone H2A